MVGIVIAFFLAISFGIDLNQVLQGGSIDLRNRITGMRLMEDHLDPYHYKWREPAPEIYCDPYNNPLLPVSKTTASPALLVLHAPLAALPYRLGQGGWLLIQWGLLLGTSWLWLRRLEKPRSRVLWMIFVTAFTYTAAWRLHAERGQAYVLLLFVFSIWANLTLKGGRRSDFFAGLVAGLSVALRPSFLLLAPFLALHRRSQLPGLLVGLFLGLGIPLLIAPACWHDYLQGMQDHSSLYRQGIDPAPPPQHYPPTIEGIPTDTVAHYAAIPYADFSVYRGLRDLGFDTLSSWPISGLLLGLFLGWLAWSRREPMPACLGGVAAWVFLADLFLPAYRNSYNDVLILAVAALTLLRPALPPWHLGFLATGVAGGCAVAFLAPSDGWMIDLPTLLYTLGAITLLLPSTWLLGNRFKASRSASSS